MTYISMDTFYIYVQCLLISIIQCSDNKQLISAPITRIHGGYRPFRFGDVVTHDCIVEYEGESTDLSLEWICLMPPDGKNTLREGNKLTEQIHIRLNESIVYYDCACHANITQISDEQIIILSAPILLTTKPIVGVINELYSAEVGKPLTVKVDYYAYPIDVTGVVLKADYSNIASQNITKSIKEKEEFEFVTNGIHYKSTGSTFYWRIENFNGNDYGRYIMKLENEVGMTNAIFTVSEKGPPSEPYNVSIIDRNSESIAITFEPGYNGSYPQWFTLTLWPTNDTTKTRRIRTFKNVIHAKNLASETSYRLILQAENEIGRSVESHIGPWYIQTEIGIGTGSHSLIQIIYVTGSFAVFCLLSGIVLTIVHCCNTKKKKTVVILDNSQVGTTATINTDRAIYTDRAVFRRTDGLPDTSTIDRVQTQTKPKARRAIKVPPVLAVFRKSRGLPDNNVLSDVHDAVANRPSIVQERDNALARHRTTRGLNYPDIEIRNIDMRPPATLPRSRQRTNYSQIDFDVQPSVMNTPNDIEDDGLQNPYGRIFYESATLPPRANY